MWHRWRLNRTIRRAHKTLSQLDAAMMLTGMTRQQRRQVWREVIAGRLTAHELVGD